MAYWNWNERHDLPRPEDKRVLCDSCAEGGEVPFTIQSDGLPMQDRPWRWAPVFGDKCHKCGKRT